MKAVCAVFLVLFLTLPASAVSVPILMYHDFVPDDAPCGEFAVTEAEFRSQLDALRENGCESVTFAELIGYADGLNDLPEKPVLITSDDGYTGVIDIAVPIVREYGMSLSCAVIGSMAGDNGHFPLSDGDIDGLEILSHTFGLHREVGSLRGVCTASLDELRGDIALMRDFAGDAFPTVSRVFVYPYGAYLAESEKILADEGFRVTVTCDRGTAEVTRGCSLFALPRVGVYHGMTGENLLSAMG